MVFGTSLTAFRKILLTSNRVVVVTVLVVVWYWRCWEVVLVLRRVWTVHCSAPYCVVTHAE